MQAPARIKATQLSASQNVKVTFSKVNNAKGYEVYRSLKQNGIYKKVASVREVKYTDKKVQKGKTYYYKIKAVAEDTKYNSSLSGSFAKVKVLARPSIKTSAAKNGKISVRWKKVSLAQGYAVYTSAKKNKGYKAVKTINKPAAGKTAIKVSGKAGKVYVKVRAFYKEKGKKGKIFGPYSKTITVKLKK